MKLVSGFYPEAALSTIYFPNVDLEIILNFVGGPDDHFPISFPVTI
jgi:hypothetical protein